jgi:hypothetical protein
MLVGPSVKDVSDDPEGAAVYADCLMQWHDLSPAARARMGKAAHTHIREQYIGDVHLLRYARLLGTLTGGE